MCTCVLGMDKKEEEEEDEEQEEEALCIKKAR